MVDSKHAGTVYAMFKVNALLSIVSITVSFNSVIWILADSKKSILGIRATSVCHTEFTVSY